MGWLIPGVIAGWGCGEGLAVPTGCTSLAVLDILKFSLIFSAIGISLFSISFCKEPFASCPYANAVLLGSSPNPNKSFDIPCKQAFPASSTLFAASKAHINLIALYFFTTFLFDSPMKSLNILSGLSKNFWYASLIS